MKKTLLILLFLIASLTGFGQVQVYLDSITVPGGTDTTWYIPGVNVINVLFNYQDFDALDATLDMGFTPTPDSSMFTRVDDDRIPLTLSARVDSTTFIRDSSVNGFAAPWLAFKLTAGTVTEGKLLYYWVIMWRK